MHDEQLSWNFNEESVPTDSEIADIPSYRWEDYITDNNPEPVTCKHKVIFRACKKGYVTYCNKCGKILSVRNRREK